MADIKSYLKETRKTELKNTITNITEDLRQEGLSVEFGKIGLRTTYALIHNEDNSTEIVGYTFLKNLKYDKEDVGKLKALQQAVARKSLAEEKERSDY